MVPSDPPLIIESTTITAKNRKLRGEWTVEIRCGWPLYEAITDLPEDQCLDDRLWPRDSNGEPTRHIPITKPIVGQRVIWKGNFFDYLWDFGVVVERDGTIYIERLDNENVWSSPVYDEARKLWVINGVCYVPYNPFIEPPAPPTAPPGMRN